MITKQEVTAMKDMREDGMTMREIGEVFGVSRATICYHVNDETKRKRIQKTTEAMRRRSPEEKRARYKKYKSKMIAYQNKRYRDDPEYRKKKQEYAREYYRRNNENR